MRDINPFETDNTIIPRSASMNVPNKIRYDIIWNTTPICSWDCAVYYHDIDERDFTPQQRIRFMLAAQHLLTVYEEVKVWVN